MEEQKKADSLKKDKQISQKNLIKEITKQDLLLNFLHEEIPSSKIFDNHTIDTLERVTKYLKEIKNIKPKTTGEKHSIPIAIFSDRTLSTLEHIITYLKEQHGLRYKEIALILNRDQRTVWTTYQRSMKKRGVSNG